jgi:hypothetical protein
LVTMPARGLANFSWRPIKRCCVNCSTFSTVAKCERAEQIFPSGIYEHGAQDESYRLIIATADLGARRDGQRRLALGKGVDRISKVRPMGRVSRVLSICIFKTFFRGELKNSSDGVWRLRALPAFSKQLRTQKWKDGREHLLREFATRSSATPVLLSLSG